MTAVALPRIQQYLTATVRPDVLYHGTAVHDAVLILARNQFNGRTPHAVNRLIGVRPKAVNEFGNVEGVSLTRSYTFARAWKSGEGVVFVLDARHLRQRHKIYTTDYYGTRREAEEFVHGSIANANVFIVGIRLSQETLDWCRADPDFEDEWVDLVKHPLLQADGARWDRMGKIER